MLWPTITGWQQTPISHTICIKRELLPYLSKPLFSSEQWSTKWWSSVWMCVFGIFFIFSTVHPWFNLQTLKRWVKWRVKIRCADNPSAEIKYRRCAITQSGVGHVDGANFRKSSLCSISSIAMPGSCCSRKYNGQLLHCSQAWGWSYQSIMHAYKLLCEASSKNFNNPKFCLRCWHFVAVTRLPRANRRQVMTGQSEHPVLISSNDNTPFMLRFDAEYHYWHSQGPNVQNFYEKEVQGGRRKEEMRRWLSRCYLCLFVLVSDWRAHCCPKWLS